LTAKKSILSLLEAEAGAADNLSLLLLLLLLPLLLLNKPNRPDDSERGLCGLAFFFLSSFSPSTELRRARLGAGASLAESWLGAKLYVCCCCCCCCLGAAPLSDIIGGAPP
jgi:hypothetical protein